MLTQVWMEVLGLDEVGVEDNFFALGGDSLSMTRVASRLGQWHGIEVSFGEFLDHPTIGGLASLLRESSGEADDAVLSDRLITEQETSLTASESELQGAFPARQLVLPRLPHEGDPLAITSVGIPTRGRPVALHRCLVGLLGNLSAYGHTPRIIILDGTPEASVAQANREVVGQILRQFNFNVVLFGPAERHRLSNRLTKAGVPPDLVRFGLQGLQNVGVGAVGANRNALLLVTVGERFISVDDDIECRFAGASSLRPVPPSDVSVRSLGDDPADIWVYPDRTSLLSSHPLFEVDFVAGHQELLGRETSHLATAVESKASAASLLPLHQRPGRILLTLNGVVGDCGWGSPSQYLFINDSSFRRLTSSSQGYMSGATSREMLRVVSSFTVTERLDNLMTGAFGADNRAILPPFLPVGRGSDVVFGRMLKEVEPLVWFGHLPWAVLHSPTDVRRFWPGEVLRSAATTDLKTMFCRLISCLPESEANTGEQSLRRMGHALVDIGSRPTPEFAAFLMERHRIAVLEEISFLEHRGRSMEAANTSCARDIDSFIRTLNEGQYDPTASIPAELLYGREIKEAAQLAKKIVLLYGQILLAWPDFITIARELHEKDVV